jgi:hypothetical protein
MSNYPPGVAQASFDRETDRLSVTPHRPILDGRSLQQYLDRVAIARREADEAFDRLRDSLAKREESE